MKFFILILYILLGYVAQAAYPKLIQEYMITGFAQGTTYTIKYYAENELVGKDEVENFFKEIDYSLSIYEPSSRINHFNLPITRSIKLDKHMLKVVKASLYYHNLTKGYFDITVYPLLKLWGFGPEGFHKNPNQQQVDSVLNFVGAKKMILKRNKLIKKDKRLSIDLNGIAQGYTVDELGVLLNNKGISSYLIEVGGEIITKGLKPNGEPYKVEIQRPNTTQSASYKVLLRDKAITTSGNYEKFRIVNGERYSHHINPCIGKPTSSKTISVTVLAQTAMDADALDNYLMYLTPEDAISFIEKIPHAEAYLIYYENNTLKELQSSGFNNYIYKL